MLDPNFKKVVGSARRNVGITQSVIEIKLPTNEDNIQSIYSVSANSTVVSSEAIGSEMNFRGIVDFQAIYESVGVSAVDYTAEFKDKFNVSDEILGEIIISSNVVDVTSTIVSGGIKVVAVIEVVIDEIYSKDISVLCRADGEGVYTREKQIEYSTYIGKASDKIEISGEFEVNDASKLLMVTPKICLDSLDTNDNYLVVRGVICLDSSLMGENGEIINHTHTFDFSQEVALEGIDNNSIIQSQLSILYNEIKVSSTLEEGGILVGVFIPVLYNGYVFAKEGIEVVEDIYSATNYLSITCESFDSMASGSPVKFRDNISGSASILETSPFIDDILGVSTNNILLASSMVSDGRLFVEGVANVTVIYYTKETSSSTSVQIEMPFSVDQKVEGLQGNVVTICLTDISSRSKRGKEIEVSGVLSVYADIFSTDSVNVISSIIEGGEKSPDDCSLYVYIAKSGQTLWDIAKEMNISEDILLEQNEGVELPLKGGEKIIIYRPKLFGFED